MIRLVHLRIVEADISFNVCVVHSISKSGCTQRRLYLKETIVCTTLVLYKQKQSQWFVGVSDGEFYGLELQKLFLATFRRFFEAYQSTWRLRHQRNSCAIMRKIVYMDKLSFVFGELICGNPITLLLYYDAYLFGRTSAFIPLLVSTLVSFTTYISQIA